MHASTRGANQYLTTQVQSCSPLELVVLLYDTALVAGQTARTAFERRDIPARRAALSRMMAVVGELQSTLDLERGGEIAARLDALYDWLTAQLVEATVTQNPKPLDQALRILETLRDGWKTVSTQALAGAAS